MANSDCDKYILIGFRTIDGILYTIKHLNIDDYSILYVDATIELLFNNYISREKKNISFEEFKLYIENELKSGLGKLKSLALDGEFVDYYYKLSNEDQLEERIDSHLNNKAKKLRKE